MIPKGTLILVVHPRIHLAFVPELPLVGYELLWWREAADGNWLQMETGISGAAILWRLCIVYEPLASRYAEGAWRMGIGHRRP